MQCSHYFIMRHLKHRLPLFLFGQVEWSIKCNEFFFFPANHIVRVINFKSLRWAQQCVTKLPNRKRRHHERFTASFKQWVHLQYLPVLQSSGNNVFSLQNTNRSQKEMIIHESKAGKIETQTPAQYSAPDYTCRSCNVPLSTLSHSHICIWNQFN